MGDDVSHTLIEVDTNKTEEISHHEPLYEVKHVMDVVDGDIGNPSTSMHAQTSVNQVVPAPTQSATSPPPISHEANNFQSIQHNEPEDTQERLSSYDTTSDRAPSNATSHVDDDASDSATDSSPAHTKRAFVLSGRDNEDADDFLLSTMLAIRTAVLAGTHDASKLEATSEDFRATRKHKISMAGDKKVEVKDYAPVVFTLIRRHFGVSIPSYLLSWSDSRLAKSRSVGKSESVFIHSPDNKFILKTLGSSEAKRLCRILVPYYEHLTQYKDTFLSRIYGLHRMSTRRGHANIYFAIFNNVFDSGLSLTEVYDLKGSTVGRRALSVSATNLGTQQRRSSTSFDFRQIRKAISEDHSTEVKKPSVLKDLDFTRVLHVGPENRKKVLAQLAIDAKFLSQNQLMDYSLLVGVRRLDATTPLSPSSKSFSPVSPASSLSPSLDLRASTTKNDTPRGSPGTARHSAMAAESSQQRVPGLLFFLESTKAATTKSLREGRRDRDRRKSLSEGSGNILLSRDLKLIEEEELDKINDETKKNTTENQYMSPEPILRASNHAMHNTTSHTTTQPGATEHPTTHASATAQPITDTSTHDTHHTTTTYETPHQLKGTELNGTTPAITVTTASPPLLPSGNIGGVEQEKTAVPPVSSLSNSAPSHLNGHLGVNASSRISNDSDDSSIGSAEESPPRRDPLGLMAVNSVPNFNYFDSLPPQTMSIPKSGSTMTLGNTNSPIVKRPNRSSSLTYVHLDPLCGNPYVPFHKASDGGGMQGANFKTLDPSKSNEVYYIGLIDFLQKYNAKKKLAGVVKSLKYERDELSTVDPVFYMERFIKMTEKAIAE